MREGHDTWHLSQTRQGVESGRVVYGYSLAGWLKL